MCLCPDHSGLLFWVWGVPNSLPSLAKWGWRTEGWYSELLHPIDLHYNYAIMMEGPIGPVEVNFMAQNYGIMRMMKINNFGGLKGISDHNSRACYDMKSLQHILVKEKGKVIQVGGTGKYATDYQEAIKNHTVNDKEPIIKKRAVLGWDIVLTATTFEGIDISAWIKANHDWLNKTFGNNNVHTLSLHLDETTPHIHCFVTPFHYSEKMGRYISGAKHWTGGPAAMRELQNSYYESVSKQFGLDRGDLAEITHAKHTEPQVFREVQKKTYEKKRRSFEEWWAPLSPVEKFEWALKAHLRMEELDQNDKRYSYFKSNLEKIKKSNPQLMKDLGMIFSNIDNQEMRMLSDPIIRDSKTGQFQKIDAPAGMETSFKLGALFGAFFALTANNEQAQFGGMNLIDFYMKVLGLDMDQAKKLAKKKNDMEL